MKRILFGLFLTLLFSVQAQSLWPRQVLFQPRWPRRVPSLSSLLRLMQARLTLRWVRYVQRPG